MILFASVWLTGCVVGGHSVREVPPSHPAIRVTGALFNKESDTLLIFQRHSDAFLALPRMVSYTNAEKARTSSGVAVTFRTDAQKVEVRFRMLNGFNNWQICIPWYVDGDSLGMYILRKAVLEERGDSLFRVVPRVPQDGRPHTYRLVMPTLNTLAFAGLTLHGDNPSLLPLPPEDKPVYLACGNSITHGRGQCSGDQTYPAVLAREMGWQLFNLAVGGASTSVPLAGMIADEIPYHVDFLSLLIGYNDAVFQMIDTSVYHARLHAFLRTVREGHPETHIFVLGQTYTETTTNRAGGSLDFDDWRHVQEEVVNQMQREGDDRIWYINAALFTGHDDLNNPPDDVVHLNVNGASRLGKALADTIGKILEK